MKQFCKKRLKELTGKKYIVFTRRGNASILAVLKLVKKLGFEDVFIQDQSGWITYGQFLQRLKLKEHRLATDYGLVGDFNIKDSVLLVNSMPGYCALQDMKPLSESCSRNNSMLVNDVSGSIGTKEAFFGDVVFGSFGRWKPLDVEEGGFIATDKKDYYEFFRDFEVEIDFERLKDKLEGLNDRLVMFDMVRSKVLNDLADFDVIHRNNLGLNIIARFTTPLEKEKLIKYCVDNKFDYLECPKYIRVLDDAISIEVKRLG